MTRQCEWFECDDGYPTEESLARLRSWLKDATPKQAAAFMLHDFVPITEQISCCRAWWVDLPKGEMISMFGGGSKQLRFATGGWSGAEDFIEVVLTCFCVNAIMYSIWRRGGYYEFEVPTNW